MSNPFSKIASALEALADEIDHGPSVAPAPAIEAPKAFDKTAALNVLQDLGVEADSLLEHPAALALLEKVARSRVAPEPLGEPSDYRGSSPPAPRNKAEAVKLAYDAFADGIMSDAD